MRVIIAIAVVTLGCAAHADSPKPKRPEAHALIPTAKFPEFIDGADAVAALQALSDLRIAELRWQTVKAALKAKYGIDPDKGDGWDPEPDGRLRTRRTTGTQEKR